MYGFNATGSISIGISSAGFNFSIDVSLNIFKLASIHVTGHYNSPSDFSFTGSGGFLYGDHTFGVGGSASITISSAGFAASVSGWAAAFAT